ncbi:MAG TPA: ABC transporter substrate-binding protein [Verrucomicrobiae bacterium]|nr:ABC transporter substrate-binding protein [Verrucomicrobiae bacterium]
MDDRLIREYSRRQFLKVTGAAGVAVGVGGFLAACSSAAPATSASVPAGAPSASGAAPSAAATTAPTGTFNWMTWGDHWYQAQVDTIAANNNIKANSTLFSDNIDAYTKLKQVGGQLDMVSGDALWVPHYFESGLIEAWDINSLQVASQLYSIARSFPIWTKPEGYLGYPFGWSPVQIYYDPAHVSPAPDSWEVLLDPKYKGRVVVEDQPVEIMAYMGKFAGVGNAYSMTPDEIAKAKDLLKQLKPNILRLANQATDTIAALKTGEAWIATGNLGTESRVKDQGGPDLNVFTPKEGTIGWMDSEMVVKGGANENLIMPFLELAEQAEYIAANFILNGRPLFNEKAYKILVNQGQQERADRFLYNKPETVHTMDLKGPGTSTQAVIDAFNEVFGS